MKHFQISWSSLVASFLVLGSLGFCGFVGVVSVMADDREIVTDTPVSNDVSSPDQESAQPGGVAASRDQKIATDVTQSESKHEDSLSPASDSKNVNAPIRVRATKTARVGNSQLLGVRLTKDGMLTGRLNLTDSISGARVPAENLLISFVQRGTILAEVKPGPGGVFQADKLSPGVVSMIASGIDGFYATALVIYPYLESGEGNEGEAASKPLQIDATVGHPSNVPTVRKLVKGTNDTKTSKTTRQPSVFNASHRVEEDSALPMPVETPMLIVEKNGQVKAVINNIDLATMQRVPAAGATIYLIQRGVVRSKTVVDRDGGFAAQGIVAGQYTLLAVDEHKNKSFSSDGESFCAIGVVVEDADGAPRGGNANKSSRLSVLPAKASRLAGDQSFSADTCAHSDYTSWLSHHGSGGAGAGGAGAGGTGGAGGGAGGGTGGGAGGGLGGFGLAAAAAAGIGGIAAAAANAANNNNNNTPASPSQP